MKVELGFLEMNALVYALHLKIEEEKKNVEKYGGDYFKNELKRSEDLYVKMGGALWKEIGSVDDFLEKLKEKKIESLL